jgi:hypothetical protein
LTKNGIQTLKNKEVNMTIIDECFEYLCVLVEVMHSPKSQKDIIRKIKKLKIRQAGFLLHDWTFFISDAHKKITSIGKINIQNKKKEIADCIFFFQERLNYFKIFFPPPGRAVKDEIESTIPVSRSFVF